MTMTSPEDPNPAASESAGYLHPDASDNPPLPDEKASNVDSSGRPHHAILYPDGTERCACASEWPCSDAVSLLMLPTEALE